MALGRFGSEMVSNSENSKRRQWRPVVIGTGITALWLGMMTSLIVAHVLPQRREPMMENTVEDPSTLTRRWRDTREFMLLKYGSAIMGAASTVVQRVDAPDVHFVANFRLGATFGFAKLKQAISLKAVGELNSEFELSGFYVESNLAGIAVRVRGETRGNELFLDTDNNGRHSLSRLQLGRRISLLEAVRPALMQKFAIRPGATYVLPVADPTLSMEQGEVEIRILDKVSLVLDGRTMSAYKVEMRLNDFVSYSWVDSAGQTLRRQIVGNLFMDRASETEAKKVSPLLNEELRMPPLDLEQFKKVPSETLDKIGAGKQSPLAVLGNLLKTE